MKRNVIAALVCAALAVPALRADVKTREKTTFALEGVMGGLVRTFGGKAAKEGITSDVALKGTRKSSISDVSGQMTAIRFWKSPRDTGPHTGHIWSATGQMLASVTFKNETSSGWQQQSLPTSVSVLANAVYVVSVSEGSNGGSTAYVALSSSGFATALVNGHLRAPAGNSGLYGKSGVLPASGSSNNYFRDVVFVADGGR